ncbi:hypothetical protein Lal_00032516 [Lupinus albus]|nr:hypothetical protein Lal_00032516 [Lupinus albus]
MVSHVLKIDPTYPKQVREEEEELEARVVGFSLKRESHSPNRLPLAQARNSRSANKCNRLPYESHNVNSPKLPFLAQARQLSLRRESSSIAQDFTLPDDPFSLRRESLAQARRVENHGFAIYIFITFVFFITAYG